MIKEFHGKYYYIEFKSKRNALLIATDLLTNKELKDEDFYLMERPEGNFVIVSGRHCNNGTEKGFRGSKYHEWERIKARARKLEKEES